LCHISCNRYHRTNASIHSRSSHPSITIVYVQYYSVRSFTMSSADHNERRPRPSADHDEWCASYNFAIRYDFVTTTAQADAVSIPIIQVCICPATISDDHPCVYGMSPTLVVVCMCDSLRPVAVAPWPMHATQHTYRTDIEHPYVIEHVIEQTSNRHRTAE
jgi:hypothetical protein